MPTVRELAEQHGVNPPHSACGVAARDARPGHGAAGQRAARERPGRVGDISLIPFWLEATLDQPAQAVSILGDFLEVRRVIAVRLMVRHREALLGQAAQLQGAAARMLAASHEGVSALRDADMAFARAMLQATGNVVALSVLNTMARVLEELPMVAQAMYAEPAANTASMARVLEALRDGGAGAGPSSSRRWPTWTR
ncbi:MAG: FCD domain-containing protein [Sandaracinaceae bacterium]|nr:FCD domain-containing protein [Sandaracinaceae bacterium]